MANNKDRRRGFWSMLLWGPRPSRWKRIAECRDGEVTTAIFARPANSNEWPYMYRISVSKSYRNRAGITRTTTALNPLELLHARRALLQCFAQLL
jgi:hypothetical protein